MKKKGMVMEIRGSSAIVMTKTGEFARVRCGKSMPICGEEYEGYEAKDTIFFRKAFITAAAAVLIFVLGIIDYCNPVKAVEINMNSKIMLKLNRWNRVMAASTPDKRGEEILSKTKIKNILVDRAIKELMLEAKKEKLIKSFSEVKVNPLEGSVDLSLINKSIKEESSADSKKVNNLSNSGNEVKNENRVSNPPKVNVPASSNVSSPVNAGAKSNADSKNSKMDNSNGKSVNNLNKNSVNNSNKNSKTNHSSNNKNNSNASTSTDKSNKGNQKAENRKSK